MSELRKVWKSAEDAGTFGAIVRLLLLTAQRRDQVTSMRWADLDGDVWHMPVEERAKGVGGDLKLPPAALDIIQCAASPRVEPIRVRRSRRRADQWVLKDKARFDKAAGVQGWVLHDLQKDRTQPHEPRGRVKLSMRSGSWAT